MADIFDIRDYIDLDDDGMPYTIFGEIRNAIKFDTTEQLSHFVGYLEDFIKFSISWEKPLSNLLKLCKILVKDIGLAKGRSLTIILASETWIYCDDIEYANTELNVFNWVDFNQWQYYQTSKKLNNDSDGVQSDLLGVSDDSCRCPSCSKPIIYTPGAKFCIYCGSQIHDFSSMFLNATLRNSTDCVDE